MARRIAIRILLFAAVALAFTFWPAIKAARPAEATLAQVPVALDNWQFTYDMPQADAAGDYLVIVHYPHDSAAAVQQAAEAMNRHAVALTRDGQQVHVTLVFKKPLSPAEFRRFVQVSGVTPTTSTVRAVQPDGLRVTMGVPPVWLGNAAGQRSIGQTYPGQDPLDEETLSRLQSRHPTNVVLGVISTEVVLDSAALSRVQNAPEVSAVDLLSEVITRQVQAQHRGTEASKIHVQGSQLYWFMEDTGIAPRR